MDFDFSSDQKELKSHARRYFEKTSPREVVHRALNGTSGFDRNLWNGVAEIGFAGTAIPETYGGSGMGYLELCVIAEELGRSLAPVPFSSSIYLAAEFLLRAGSDEQKQSYLPKLASGASIGTFAAAERPGAIAPDRIATSASGGRITGEKIPVPDGMCADFAIVLVKESDHPPATSLYIIELDDPAVTRKSVSTIDPTRGHAHVSFANAKGQRLGGRGEGWRLVEAVLDRAAVLFAFEQIGGADRALETARDYALQRWAFGRPIGSFQALKHMMADMYVAATLARSNAYYAAWALSSDSPELCKSAAAARISATQAYQRCAKNNIQIHGGIAFTWQFDCHLYYRRSNLLALTLGSLPYWEDRFIGALRMSQAAA